MATSTALNDLHSVLPEGTFLRALCLERKRAERSRNPFVLMRLEIRGGAPDADGQEVLAKAVPAILACVRETDIVGWHKQAATLGVIFAELGAATKAVILDALRTRVLNTLRSVLPTQALVRLHLAFHWFPDDTSLDADGPSRTGDLYPDLVARDELKKGSRIIKRGIDMLGSALALILLSPVLVVVALLVKLTSPGPVLFHQTRIGQHGVPFTFLKFRSMYAVNDDRIHRDYVTRFINGQLAEIAAADGNGGAVYKITKDPRLTPVGGFLRRSSLDELPQFLNVLRGEMSIVGPRPPLPYETDAYDLWHWRRVHEVKPGITGLWQVNGRSRLRFDDMVRLDLRYAKTWSVWLDLKILLRTPAAVVFRQGAY